MQDFITLFLGLIVETLPFLVLGVTVSVLVGLFFKEEWILAKLPRNTILANLLLSLLGTFMPVCECGNVPVVRRLIAKGFKPSQAVTFLLAAPIINPVTIYSTMQAFNFDQSYLWYRLLGAFFVANFVGFLLSFKSNQNDFLTGKFYDYVCHHHDDHHDNKVVEGLEIFRSEFVEMAKMLVIGAAIAAASQAFIPRDVIVEIGSNPVLSVLTMMLLAFVISICANVDAFFALSYANTFTSGAIIAFLIFGPMIDIKMLTILRTTFKWKFLGIVTVVVALLSAIIGLSINLIS